MIELRDTRKEARRCLSSIDDEIKPLRQAIKSLKDLIAEIDTKQRAMCIAGRTTYSKGNILFPLFDP